MEVALGSTPLTLLVDTVYSVYTVYTVYRVDLVYTVYMVFTVDTVNNIQTIHLSVTNIADIEHDGPYHISYHISLTHHKCIE